MSCEGLPAHAVSDVPQLDRSIASARDEGAHVGGQREGHDVPAVACEGGGLLARLDVPQGTGKEEREAGSQARPPRGFSTPGLTTGLIRRAKMDMGRSDGLRELVLAESE